MEPFFTSTEAYPYGDNLVTDPGCINICPLVYYITTNLPDGQTKGQRVLSTVVSL